MNALLLVHISLGGTLLLAFVGRYIAVLAGKLDPRVGRQLIVGLAAALVASGVAVAIVYRAPITGACMDSLGIIALVLVLEWGLSRLALHQHTLGD